MKFKIGRLSATVSSAVILLGICMSLYLLDFGLQDRPVIPPGQDDLGAGLQVVTLLIGLVIVGGIIFIPLTFLVFTVL